MQAGYIRPLGRGLYSELPLGTRVIERLTRLIRFEMERVGGQEVRVPVVNPAELWKRGGRSEFLHRDIVRFADRDGHELLLAPSHEEAMVQLAKDALHSCRELPVFLFQFQTKFRDEEHTRFGMIRAKEFVMKDGYSFHRSTYDLNNFFPKVFAAYQRIFNRCRIEVTSAEAGVGFMGGEKAYEFLMPAENGDNTLVVCDHCGYRANRDIAKGIKEPVEAALEPSVEVHTPGCTTMGKLARALGLSRNRLAKPLVYRYRDGFVVAVVRGDYELSEEKLSNHLGAPLYGLASPDELAALGLVPGFISPVGRDDLLVVVDDAVASSPNLVFGANRRDYHMLNVNFARDYVTERVADIAQVNNHDRCLQCHRQMRTQRTIEVGNIFKLGDFYTRRLGLQMQDERGRWFHPHMGSYGIGLGRLLSCVVESNADDRGLRWPEALAPFQVYLMGIGSSPGVKRVVDAIYQEIPDETLLDDRSESTGVRFKDADLLGIPWRVVVAPQLLGKGVVELQSRWNGDRREIAVEAVARTIVRNLPDAQGAEVSRHVG